MKHARYSLRPLVVSASVAHAEGYVVYDDDGSVRFWHPALRECYDVDSILIEPAQQFPCIFATFLDLSKALSSTANSPLAEGNKSLRQSFDAEFSRYRDMVSQCRTSGQWEPDYGSYVFDVCCRRLYLVAPEYWHRLALTTSAGALLSDATRSMHWRQVRECLEHAVVGVVGTSVGSNIVEGICRELRPRQMKLADPDWIELTNLNRLERAGYPALTSSRQARRDPRNAFELHRYNKAEITAYHQNLVDPYAEFFVYSSGIDEDCIDRFLCGGHGEPRVQLVIEEADDISLKVYLRRRCRELGIPVLMMTDFGHIAAMHFQDFARVPSQSLAYDCDDVECEHLLQRCLTTGNRSDLMTFVTKFVGADCIRDEFDAWVRGDGEQPTSSLPQSGATAMISGGIAGKAVARHFLGHMLPDKVTYDFARHSSVIATPAPAPKAPNAE